jgi:AraC-like DNA-binding protein
MESMALLQIKAYIESHYNKHITIEQICDQAWPIIAQAKTFIVFFTRPRLLNAFKTTYHLTIHQYQTAIRMERARILLLTTDQGIKAIALAIGYTGVNNFAPIFKRHFGLTPADYRKQFLTLR